MLEAIDAYASDSGDEFRFFILTQALDSDSVPLIMKATIISLFNCLIDSLDNLEKRFSMRTEIMTMGLQESLAVSNNALKKHCNWLLILFLTLQRLKSDSNMLLLMAEIDHFEQEQMTDYEDMRCKFNKKLVIDVSIL